MSKVVRILDAYFVPWWPGNHVKPAEVEYIGPWPDGGSGMCVKHFDAATVAESNQLARTWALAFEAGAGAPVDRDDYWEIAA